MQNKNIKKKQVQTCLKKYGVDNPSKNTQIKEKIKQSCLKHYGVEYPIQNNQIKKKIKETLLKKYNIDIPLKYPLFRDKMINIQLELYGGIGFASDEIMKSIEDSNLKKYGVPYVPHKGYSESSQLYFRQLDKYFNKYTTYFKTKNNEKRIGKYSLDYYIEELQICIEYNDTYWHMDPNSYNPNDYNEYLKMTALEKWNMDKERKKYIESKGIKVITVWENNLPLPKDIANKILYN